MTFHKHTAQEPQHINLLTYTVFDCIQNKTIRIEGIIFLAFPGLKITITILVQPS